MQADTLARVADLFYDGKTPELAEVRAILTPAEISRITQAMLAEEVEIFMARARSERLQPPRIMLLEHADVSIEIKFYDDLVINDPQLDGRAYISFVSSDRYLCLLTPEPVELDRYEIEVSDPEVFDSAVEISDPLRTRMLPLRLFHLKANRETCVFDSSRPFALLVVSSAPRSALDWVYTKTSRRPLQATKARPLESNLDSMLQLVVASGRRDLADKIEPLLHHPTYFVRWSALEALSELGHSGAARHLERMLDDPHPEIRSAAALALAEG